MSPPLFDSQTASEAIQTATEPNRSFDKSKSFRFGAKEALLVGTELTEQESELKRDAERQKAGIDVEEDELSGNQSRNGKKPNTEAKRVTRTGHGTLFWLRGLRLTASEVQEQDILCTHAAFEEGLEQHAVGASQKLLQYDFDNHLARIER